MRNVASLGRISMKLHYPGKMGQNWRLYTFVNLVNNALHFRSWNKELFLDEKHDCHSKKLKWWDDRVC